MRLIVVLALVGVLLAPVPAVSQATADCTVNLENFDLNTSPLIPASLQIGTVERIDPPYKLHLATPCSDDWLEGVQVKFRNMTNRTVIGVWIHVDFPDTEGPQTLRIGYTFHVGATPERSTYKPDKTRAHVIQHPALQDPPRSEVTIALKPEYSNIKQVVERQQPIGTINSIWIRIVQVYFADGTVFNGGYRRPDPNDPTAYVNAGDPNDFRAGRPVQ